MTVQPHRPAIPDQLDPRPVSLDEVKVLVFRAQGGDPTAAPRLRTLFDRDPSRLMQLGGGDVAASLKNSLVDRAVRGQNILAREARLRRIDELRDELAGPSPTPIERLLADRVALCWFELHTLDAEVTRLRDEEEPRAAGLDRFRDRAQRRYLAALKGLALLRKLVVPVLQVNVAQNQQINQGSPPDGA